MTHTATPWKDGPVFGTDGRALYVTDTSKPGKWQRRVDGGDGVFATQDAAFIVRAVNAHDELVAALDALITESPNQTKAGDMARAILAKVKG